ncbi:hypothetical protein [Psychroserpens luteolus]|uniref:hypothetical protein n=1 Tax=Psychroserpens luteolus TaxID=2855840 RepID=UPI001E53EF1C|nr:hypothetical protein [Psychroserpens luteolus]MCD2259418.1 hypothetical protein [Psychroserpens luteolus]
MFGRFHLFFGIIIVIVFLLTGQYMHHKYDHLKDMELMNRALFRAGHLYILLFGLVNVALGAYMKPRKHKFLNKVQSFGSVTIIIASCLVIYAFFTELPTEDIERPLTRLSLYMVFFGVTIHGLISLMKNKLENPNN